MKWMDESLLITKLYFVIPESEYITQLGIKSVYSSEKKTNRTSELNVNNLYTMYDYAH